jgi:Mce-associated membrane protein
MSTQRRPRVAGERARAKGRAGAAVLDRPQRAQQPPQQTPHHPSHQPPPLASSIDDHDPGRRLRVPTVRAVPSVVAMLLAVVMVLLLVATGVVGYRVRTHAEAEQARTAALAAARAHVADLLSYDYRTLERDFARGRGVITGAFADDYRATTSEVVRPTAERYQAVVKADVVAASTVSAGPDRATVLLFVNQTTTSTRLDGPKVDLNRVRVTLVQRDGTWLVSDLDAL